MKSEKLTQFEKQFRQMLREQRTGRLLGCHGFSAHEESGTISITLYVIPKVLSNQFEAQLKAEISNIDRSVKVDAEPVEEFAHNNTPGVAAPIPAPAIMPVPLLPGAPVSASSTACPTSSQGTIGGYLRLVDSPDQTPRLLTAFHVLVGRSSCLPGVVARSGGMRIGGKIDFVPINPSGNNKADAAVVLVEDPGAIATSVYPAEFGRIQKEPVSLIPGKTVFKRGAKTNTTSGTVSKTGTFFVKDRIHLITNELIDQVMIESASENFFSCEGDSGSIVFQDGHPAGLLIADNDDKPCSRIGLVTPFQTVLDEFERTRQLKFELIVPDVAV